MDGAGGRPVPAETASTGILPPPAPSDAPRPRHLSSATALLSATATAGRLLHSQQVGAEARSKEAAGRRGKGAGSAKYYDGPRTNQRSVVISESLRRQEKKLGFLSYPFPTHGGGERRGGGEGGST